MASACSPRSAKYNAIMLLQTMSPSPTPPGCSHILSIIMVGLAVWYEASAAHPNLDFEIPARLTFYADNSTIPDLQNIHRL